MAPTTPELIARTTYAAEDRVGRQYLEPAEHRAGWQVKDMDVAGRFAWDDDQPGGHPYRVIVDGRTLTWAELGDALESFEGWEFQLRIVDRVEDARSDADILAFPDDPVS